ncbi:MAG: YncE family protein [Candidatus Zhuqueibacterota bacterium]
MLIKKLILSLCLSFVVPLHAEITVTTVDFLDAVNLNVNAAGPMLVKMDAERNRVVVANTLSSSVSIIDGATRGVANIRLSSRVLQHLKSDAMTIHAKTGDVYLLGIHCFFIISPEKQTAFTVTTATQFETIAVDEHSGNVFLAGRQSKSLGFFHARSGKFRMVDWLDFAEELMNLNATPPPPIRRVVLDRDLNRAIAIDGLTARLFLFDPGNCKLMETRQLSLNKGGRWHFAGYNQSTHSLYLALETDQRRVIQAARIGIAPNSETIIELPQLTEGVGITYFPDRDEIYIPYDNHPTVHVVNFKQNGMISEIKLPAFGNDASAVDFKNERLYIASWAHGEIDVVDLKTRQFVKRIPGLGILPHMFSMAFNPNDNQLYIPRGATAVNGAFGAAISVLNPVTEEMTKIYTGWAPIDLVAVNSRNSVLVFNSEDQFAEVNSDGQFQMHRLPFDYPICAGLNAAGDVSLSYGAHQSYWPDVYIWDAKNGILTLHTNDLSVYDRRIPRQAQQMAIDKNGVLYFTQNNWGSEEQFIGRLEDEVRLFEIGKRLPLKDQVTRETTQRILEYDAALHRLYLVRAGETDSENSIFQVIDLDSQKVIHRSETGRSATDLMFDSQRIYIANFESNTVTTIDKATFAQTQTATGDGPLTLRRFRDGVYVINHLANSVQEIGGRGSTWPLPVRGLPDNMFVWENRLIITCHQKDRLVILQFNPGDGEFTALHQFDYPFGDTRFDTRNASFYMNGQFGDAIYSLTKAVVDSHGRLWMTDFLAGKLFIFEAKP